MSELQADSVERSDVFSNKVSITANPTPSITANPTPSITANPTPSITANSMPVLDGFRAARGMREHERLSGSPAKIIIGISAVSEGTSCDDVLAAGVNKVIFHPSANFML
jgi:CheY-like chemotaxis protein